MTLFSLPQVQAALWMASSGSLVLLGYECLRSASNSLFKAEYGTAGFPFLMALLPFVILPTLAGYNRLLGWVGAKRTLFLCHIIASSLILACYGAIRVGFQPATGLLCLIRDVYVVVLIEQHWSFLTSILKEEQAQRLNGLIMTIASIGGVIGGFLAHLFAEKTGSLALVLAPAICAIPSLFLIEGAYRGGASTFQEKLEKKKGLWVSVVPLFRDNPVLPALLFMVIMSQTYGTLIDLGFQECLLRTYPSVDKQTAVSGLFFSLSNGLSLVFQLFLTPWLLTTYTPNRIHLAIPWLHLVCITFCICGPGIWTLGAALLLFKAVDYSLFRGAKELLYIPLSFSVRFQAKECIDILGYRGSKSVASSLLFFAKKFLGFSFTPLSLSWLGGASLVGWVQASLWMGGQEEGQIESEISPILQEKKEAS
jgi:AAA family ATP:ADP antiporter